MSWVLRGPAQRFEPREWFAGPGVVELALAGDIGAIRYVEPRPLVCTAPRVTVRSGPDAAAEAGQASRAEPPPTATTAVRDRFSTYSARRWARAAFQIGQHGGVDV